MANPREQFERTECACDDCKSHCKREPGFLIPGDWEQICERKLGDDLAQLHNFVTQNFRCSDKTKAITPDGLMVIPTIVPARKDDGSCVFLDENERCTIHDIAPYGCSHFDDHMEFDEGHKRMQAGVAAIMNDPAAYCGLWALLADNDLWKNGARQV